MASAVRLATRVACRPLMCTSVLRTSTIMMTLTGVPSVVCRARAVQHGARAMSAASSQQEEWLWRGSLTHPPANEGAQVKAAKGALGKVSSMLAGMFKTSKKEEVVSHPTWQEMPSGATSVSFGPYHGACIDNDGNVLVIGSNTHGQLGIADMKQSTDWTKIKWKTPKRFRQVSVARNSTLMLAVDGRVYLAGIQPGQSTGAKLPVIVDRKPLGGATVVQVVAGDNFNLLLTDAGDVYSFGPKDSYGLGLGTPPPSSHVLVPKLLPVDVKFSRIGGTGENAWGLSVDGRLITWGKNNQQILGRPVLIAGETTAACGDPQPPRDQIAPLLPKPLAFSRQSHAVGFAAEGILEWSLVTMHVVAPPAGEQWIDVAAGRSFTAAVTDKGRLYTWVTNPSGGGLPSTLLGLSRDAGEGVPVHSSELAKVLRVTQVIAGDNVIAVRGIKLEEEQL